MTKIVVNACHGGFGLSDQAVHLYAKKKGIVLYAEPDMFSSCFFLVPPKERIPQLPGVWMSHSQEARIANNKALAAQCFHPRDIPRSDPALVEVVEKLKDKASGRLANLVIIEIPDDVNWVLEEYDGFENIAESHRTWHAA